MKKPAVRDNQEGSALIPVVCVLLVLAAIVLSMIFAAYQVYTTAIQSFIHEQSRVLAESLDETLGAELMATSQEGAVTSSLQQKIYEDIKSNIENGTTWPQHTKREIKVDIGNDAVPGNEVTIQMEWNSTGTDLASVETQVELTAYVTVVRQNQTCTVTSKYNRSPSSDPAMCRWMKQP